MRRAYFHASSMANIAGVIVEALWHLARPVVDVVIERDRPWTDGNP